MISYTRTFGVATPEAERLVSLLGSRRPAFESLPNRVAIPANGFWHHWSIWGAPKLATNLDSLAIKQTGGVESWATPMLFLIDHSEMAGAGFVVLSYYSGPRYGEQDFFVWRTCLHEWETTNLGRCYNRYTCKKCGGSYEVDSGD